MAVLPGNAYGSAVIQPLEEEVSYALTAVDLKSPGHPISTHWQGVPGVTKIEIESAWITIGPDVVSEYLGSLGAKKVGQARELTIPQSKRIAALTLRGLQVRTANGTWKTLRSSADLGPSGPRILISIPGPAGEWMPLYAVPAVSRRGALPSMFSGARFSGGVLTLPAEVASDRLLLSVVNERFPEDFVEQQIQLTRVFATASLPSRNLELIGPNHEVAWAFPGEMTQDLPSTDVDLRPQLEAALNDALSEKLPLEVTYRLRGDSPGRAGLHARRAKGALVREFKGVMTTRIEGDTTPMNFNNQSQEEPLADETPTEAVADITVRFEGIRIHEAISDSMPSTQGGLEGLVVTNQPTLREFPPAAFDELAIARVGIIGRAPEACELSVQLMDLTGGAPGTRVGSPVVISAKSSTTIQTTWVPLPDIQVTGLPLGISVRANSGRFFWVGEPKPLVRVAVHDDDPGGRALRLDGQNLVNVEDREMHLPAEPLDECAFRVRPPQLESDLFLTVDVSDLRLRYAR